MTQSVVRLCLSTETIALMDAIMDAVPRCFDGLVPLTIEEVSAAIRRDEAPWSIVCCSSALGPDPFLLSLRWPIMSATAFRSPYYSSRMYANAVLSEHAFYQYWSAVLFDTVRSAHALSVLSAVDFADHRMRGMQPISYIKCIDCATGFADFYLALQLWSALVQQLIVWSVNLTWPTYLFSGRI